MHIRILYEYAFPHKPVGHWVTRRQSNQLLTYWKWNRPSEAIITAAALVVRPAEANTLSVPCFCCREPSHFTWGSRSGALCPQSKRFRVPHTKPV